jgi:uncharacterized protein (DUF2235 family)
MSTLDAIAEQPVPPNQSGDSDERPGWRMPNKKIIVCCDGTGNEFRAGAPKETDTEGNSNVVKLYTSLDLSLLQIAYYHPGVGTMGDPSKQGLARGWSKVKGLAFGWGFRENVLDAYRYLMQHYNAGDTVYIFGFSRGAYTARALAGFLHGYGLLCRGNEGHILYAWNLYTAKLKKQRTQDDPQQTVETDFAFRDTFSHADFMMHFVGLWDTVSSVGWITTPMRLLHLAQNPSIVTGRHAISIDERRCFYHDNLWGDAVKIQIPPILRGRPEGEALDRLQDIAQVWFPGVHSDVGGSYGQYSAGLANDSLTWMMEQAAAAGAVFKKQRVEAVLGEPVVDDPQRRTEQLQCLYPKPASWNIHKSLDWKWWMLELFPHRYYSTDADKKEILRVPWGAWRRLPDEAMLHKRVMDWEGDAYAYESPNLKCGKRHLIGEGPWKGYGRFEAPPQKGGWRESRVVVFGFKAWLTAIPVMILWWPLMWVLGLMSDEGVVPASIANALSELKGSVFELGAALGDVVWVVGWSLAIAAVVVLFWTLVRLVWPRS